MEGWEMSIETEAARAAYILADATETNRDYAGPQAVSALAEVAARVIKMQDEQRETDRVCIAELRREVDLVRGQLDAEIVRLSREKARLALENDRLQSEVKRLTAQRDDALEAEEMHGRHWDQECEENARLRARLLAEHGDCGSEECDVCALLERRETP